MKYVAGSLALVFFTAHAFATGVSGRLSYQGRIIKPNGQPLEASSVTFTLQVRSPNANNCILYEETHTENMAGTGGVFYLVLGTGVRGDNDPGLNFKDVFSNAMNFSSLSCDSGTTYSPANGHVRKLKLTFNDGGGAVAVNPDMDIQSVPYAFYAEKLQGKGASDLLQVTTSGANNLTQSNLQSAFTNTNYPKLMDLINGNSNQYISSTPTSAVGLNSQRLTNLADPTGAQDAATKNYTDMHLGGNNLDDSDIASGVGDGKVLTWDAAGNKWVAEDPVTGMDNLGNHTATQDLDMDGSKIVNMADPSAAQDAATKSYVDTKLITRNLPAAPAAGQDQMSLKYDHGTGAWIYYTPITVGADNLGDHTATQNIELGPNYLTGDGTNKGIFIDVAGNVGVGDAHNNPVAVLDVKGNIKVANSSTTCNATHEGEIRYDATANALYFCAETQWKEVGDAAAAGVVSIFGRSGTVTAQAGDYNAGQITNTAAGNIAATNVQAAINELDTEKVAKSGDTMTGDLAMSTNKITGLGDPTAAQDAATKAYVDGRILGNAVAAPGAGQTGQAIRWDGLAWEYFTPSTGNVSSSTEVIAGSGLTGGGDLSANRTLNVGAGTGIVVNANDVAVDVGTTGNKIVQLDGSGRLPAVDGSQLTNLPSSADNLGNHTATADLDMDSRKIVNVTDPSAAQDAATKNYVDTKFITMNLPAAPGAGQNEQSIKYNHGTGAWVYYTPTTGNVTDARAINTGNGLTGGGDLSADRTISMDLDTDPGLEFNTGKVRVKAGSGISRTAAGINVDIDGVTAEATPDNADMILIYDNSAGALRKQTRSQFLSGIGGSDNLGNHTATADLNMASNKITSVADPTAAQDAATKAYVDGRWLGNTLSAPAGGQAGQAVRWNAGATAWEYFTPSTGDVPSTRDMIAGAGLTGGGTLAADRTFNVGAGAGIAVAADSISVDINGTTAESTVDNADKILIYDSSAAALRSMTRADFLTGLGAGSGDVSNNGNTFGGNMILGTNDNFDLGLETNSVTRMTLKNTGHVGIGTVNPDTSALLDIESVTRGFLLPRMTTAQRDGIASPATGLQIYNVTDNRLQYFNGTVWSDIGTGVGVSTVFGRGGAVTAETGDYDAVQIDNTAAGNIAATNVQAAINELDNEKVAKSGDTMTGALAMSTNKITGLGNPTAAQDAATKSYVDGNLATRSIAVPGGSESGKSIMFNGTSWAYYTPSTGDVLSTREINTGSGLTGGGNLSANRTIAVANNGITGAHLQSDGSVDGNRAVTTNHIRDGAVTDAKVASGISGSKLLNASVSLAKFIVSGTPSSSTFLRGDGVWATPPSGGSLSWTPATTSQSMTANAAYMVTAGTRITLEVPSSCAVGDTINILGASTSGFQVTVPNGVTIKAGTSTVDSNSNFYIDSWGGAVELICTTADSQWTAKNAQGMESVTGKHWIEISNTSACVVLGESREMKCWGANSSGILGYGDTTQRCQSGGLGCVADLSAVSVDANHYVKKVVMGSTHTCALLANDQVKCWGSNASGQLGIGSTTTQCNSGGASCVANLAPINLGAGRTAKDVVAAHNSTCILLDTDELKCFGNNGSGVLGYGDTTSRCNAGGTTCFSSLPAVDVGAGRKVKKIALSAAFACAILDNDTLKCWGVNGSGQLGIGSTTTTCSSGGTTCVANLAAIDLGGGRYPVSVTVGNNHTCVLMDNSQVKCWGHNANGALGLGDTTNRCHTGGTTCVSSLTAIDLGGGASAVDVQAGYQFTCVLMNDSQMKCWGYNGYGQLGIGSTTATCRTGGASCVAVSEPLNFGSSRSVKSFKTPYDANGDANSVCAILDNDQIKCWGRGNSGQLGYGDTSNRTSSGGVTALSDLEYVALESGASENPLNLYGGGYDGNGCSAWGRSKCTSGSFSCVVGIKRGTGSVPYGCGCSTCYYNNYLCTE